MTGEEFSELSLPSEVKYFTYTEMSSDRSACIALRIAKAVGESTGATGRAIAIGSERRGPFNSALLGEKPLVFLSGMNTEYPCIY
jgi:hypothetical protein